MGAGHRCVLAADGERALELLAAGGIDAVVLDPAMPLHDGWPVLDAASVPVIALSPLTRGAGDRVAVRVPKPFAAADLVAAVDSVLRVT